MDETTATAATIIIYIIIPSIIAINRFIIEVRSRKMTSMHQRLLE